MTIPGNTEDASGLSVAIVMASAGRAELLGQVLDDLLDQSYPITAHVVSVPDEDSLPRQLDPTWQVVSGSRGLTAQRNAGLDALPDVDVVFFFDDDAVVHRDYVRAAVDHFARNPRCLAITGTVLADGVIIGEIDRDPAVELVHSWRPSPAGPSSSPSRTLFGANFAIRIGEVPDLRFDERLVLYSWLEDHDVARRLGAIGDLAKLSDAVIVHRGASSGGRTNHMRLGYSQIMNPVYLQRKGSFPVWLTAWEIFRPTAKNVVYAVYGPQRSWRRVRLAGNARAVFDACRGRITPERIVQF